MKPDFSAPIEMLRQKSNCSHSNALIAKMAGVKEEEKAFNRTARNFALAAQVLETHGMSTIKPLQT